MKRLSTLTLSVFLFSGLIFAESTEDTSIFRINGLYVDEIIDGGDGGLGATVEYAFIIHKADNFFTTIGYELGYIQSEIEEGQFGTIPVGLDGGSTETNTTDIKTELTPFFVNYRIRGGLEDPKAFWEVGAGVGVVFANIDIDLDVPSDLSDEYFVSAGQVFGSLGYELTETIKLLFGARYMISDDFDFRDSIDIGDQNLDFDFQLDKVLGSIAFDISLNFVF